MEFIKHLKSAIGSVVPFYIILAAAYTYLVGFSLENLIYLTISTVAMILGLSMFFPGLKNSLEDGLPMLAQSLLLKHSRKYLFIFIFLLGFTSTLSEPNLEVFVVQFTHMIDSLSDIGLLVIISFAAAGFFILATIRLVLHISMRLIFFIMYGIFFIIVVFFMSSEKLGIVFDSGGAATGLVTVPFMTVFGISIAEHIERADNEDKFGFAGIASAGVLILLSIFLISLHIDAGSDAEVVEDIKRATMIKGYFDNFFEVVKLAAPFTLVFVYSELVILKHRGYILRSRVFGFIFMFIGVMLILSSATVVYIPFVRKVAQAAFLRDGTLTIIIGTVFGFLAAFLEPSVKVLALGIEKELNGRISNILIVAAIGVGLALTMFIFLIKLYFPFDIRWFFYIIYAIIFILLIFTDKLFVGISFDAGAAGAGVMSGVILLPYVLMATSLSDSDNITGFGVIGGTVAFPILICEVLGIIYGTKIKKEIQKEAKKNTKQGVKTTKKTEKLEHKTNKSESKALKKAQKSEVKKNKKEKKG